MSGYLQRLAARSVGSSGLASALPRLPARFEPTGLEGAGLEVADERLTSQGSPAAPGPRSPADPRPGLRPLDPPTASRGEVVPGGRRPSASPVTAPRRAAVAAAPVVATPARVDGPAPTGHVETLQGVASPPAPGVVAEPTPSLAHVAARPAGRARPPLAAERRDAHAHAAQQAASQVPMVRVHIGRVEVRANVQSAPAAAPAVAHPGPAREELALSAYLRGERQAR